MAISKEYIDFVLENIHGFENVRARKMFGEYMVYINDKPVLFACDNTVFVKKLSELLPFMENAECGLPYEGTKEHYILDIENEELSKKVISVLEAVTPVPKKKTKKNKVKTPCIKRGVFWSVFYESGLSSSVLKLESMNCGYFSFEPAFALPVFERRYIIKSL